MIRLHEEKGGFQVCSQEQNKEQIDTNTRGSQTVKAWSKDVNKKEGNFGA